MQIRHSPNWIHIPLPLDNFNPFRRIAFGIGNAKVVYLNIRTRAPFEQPVATAFCLHLDEEFGIQDQLFLGRVAHGAQCTPWPTGGQHPNKTFCGSHPNRLIYQLNGIVWRNLRQTAVISDPSLIQNVMTSEIARVSQNCIVCGKSTSSYLIRSTPCSKLCSIYFRQSQLLVRFPEIRYDRVTVAHIFAALMAAAQCDHLSLLGNIPMSLPKPIIITIVNQISEMMKQQPLDVILANSASVCGGLVDPQAELLVAWGLSSYRGCAVAIPDENVYAKASVFFVYGTPERENQFAERLAPTGGHSSIVYHGTTLDRLYPILQNGLQTQLRPEMMQHGAAYGNGVYTTPNINIAPSYSRNGPPTPPIAQLGWEQHAYPVKVLLICELVDMERWKTSHPEILVITDSSNLIVRLVIVADHDVGFGDLDPAKIHRSIRLARS
jgi:Poly(ADP-ribose) polymerase catalytic domain